MACSPRLQKKEEEESGRREGREEREPCREGLRELETDFFH
jgi:hypothetical protein